jgi:hypothetical protein
MAEHIDLKLLHQFNYYIKATLMTVYYMLINTNDNVSILLVSL